MIFFISVVSIAVIVAVAGLIVKRIVDKIDSVTESVQQDLKNVEDTLK